MKRMTIVMALFAGLVSGAAESRPGWASESAEPQRSRWQEWRNSLASRGKAVSLPLAARGKTDYVIVTPRDASAGDRRAADELQVWLTEITGVNFPVVPDSEPATPRELSVGKTTRASELGKAAMETAGLPGLNRVPREGYAITVEGERVFLLGGEQLGPLAAVLAFLEEDLGVRWYEPATRQGSWAQLTRDLGAKPWARGAFRAPRRDVLQAAIVPRTAAPAFPIRHLSWQRSYNPWALRNRVNGGYVSQYGQHGYASGSFFVHTFHRLVPPKVYATDHPEYYPLIGGQRKWKNAQLCLSNPAVATAAGKTAAKLLRGVPESQRSTKHLLSVSAEDWLGDCECNECRAIEKATGGYSGLLITFVNRVAEHLAPDYPWVTITTLAYRQSKQPPTAAIRAHPNVAVRFCTDFGASFTWPYHSLYDDHIGDLAEQRQWFTRWQEVCPRMHLWIYPHQYRNYLAPMPNLRAVAANLRFFREHNAESTYVQQSLGHDRGRDAMRYWVFAKLMWDPNRNVENLCRDFIWGYYGAAAPAVLDYEELLREYCVRYADFSRERNWIYAIHDEDMYRHGFTEKARAILERAESAAKSGAIRSRIGLLKAGVLYVESVQLYMQMRDGQAAPDTTHYAAVTNELGALCTQLGVEKVGFFDGTRTVGSTTEWIAEMRKVHERRCDQRNLSAEHWGTWAFRWDPENEGVAKRWFAPDTTAGNEWTPVDVPAFLARTPAGNAIGFGWYRTTFSLPPEQAGKPVELEFGGVDEQAWVYVNGEQVGEHTLESEFMVGEDVTVADLWNRPFQVTVGGPLLKTGENALTVRIHNSAMNAGIHQPVQVYLLDEPLRDFCDGAILNEDFADVKTGGIPAAWERHIQQRGSQVFGLAEVSRHFVRRATLLLRDQRSHVAVWSRSDDVLPESGKWVVQFDVRMTGGLVFKASDTGPYKAGNAGALFGLKRGTRKSPDYLPLVQLDNAEEAGKPVTLSGLGHVLATDLAPDRWHRIAIHRDGTSWHFYLDNELKATVLDRDTNLRGYAFGSFRDWPHVAQDVHIADLKIGNAVNPD
ncbi:MAG: DUF4838 domain-containing protein [Lentisphaerae bacterium]|jgi:hypothetical protein|nr:DUF4838 domain-containing protein [Lentisphaerota bacterium]MBT4822292.1 DUF4838 domain-containing protein [Lentisphaerota bacterium]MBT5612016.1 DUF4838 domain-containing protein [Lentisphaerota bacterium]MBT7054764.1 DUF4838 domain-containing protein [Lentisphaerota bacterium]